MVRLSLRFLGVGQASDRCLIWVNVCLFVSVIFWLFNYSLLTSRTSYIEIPVKDHEFDNDEDYTLETFEFMEKHREGKAPRTNIVVGPLQVESQSCWLSNPSYPAAEDIQRSGPDWQTLYDADKYLEMYVYNAYYDTRKGDMFPTADGVIQVLMMVRRQLTIPMYCQFWSPDKQLLTIVKSHHTEIWQRPWDPRNRFYVGGLLSCPIPKALATKPRYVSLNAAPCDQASNALKIIGYDHSNSDVFPPDQHNVVVCVKGMDFLNDISHRLVEWLEAQLLFGADKILLYTYSVHASMAKVLKHYEHTGRVQHITITLPGNQPNIPAVRSRYIKRNRQQKRRNELIPYNDCMMRHIQTHRYALIVDIDELVVPQQHDDWPSLLANLSVMHPIRSLSAHSIINVYKFDNLTTEFDANIPDYMWMLRHDQRSMLPSPIGEFSKCFMHIPNILTVFNHYPLHRLRRNVIKSNNVREKLAVKLHYKAECPVELKDTCPRYWASKTTDRMLDRFSSRLIDRVTPVMKTLKLI